MLSFIFPVASAVYSGLIQMPINLSRSIPPVWEPFHGSIRPNPMLQEHIPVTEPEITYLPQREQSNCMYDGHISSSEVIVV